jgi:uncharacterized damage-inducible protein DinB
MDIKELLISEWQEESAKTEKILSCIPEAQLGWKPHEKSMTLQRLATHIAENFGRGAFVLNSDELDFAKMPYNPLELNSVAELISLVKTGTADSVNALQKAADADFSKQWTMRAGDVIYFQSSKYNVLRSAILNHIYHHRGQLSVYLRLLNVPVPGMFGPSADDNR